MKIVCISLNSIFLQVKLQDKISKEVFIFNFDQWFSKDLDNGDLTKELPVITDGVEPLAGN